MSNAKTATSMARHDAGEQGGRFDGLRSLPLERVAERIDLLHHQVDRASRLRARAADRIVPLVQGAEQVGREEQHARHHLIGGDRAADPHGDDDGGERPADLEGVVLAPGDPGEGDGGRQTAEQARAPGPPARGSSARGPFCRHRLLTDAILLEPAVERAAAHPELLCRLPHVSLMAREHLFDEDALGILERKVVGRGCRRGTL